MMDKYADFLAILANRLRREGKNALVEEIENNWDEFIELLENGELNFDPTQSGSPRGTNTMNRGREMPAFGVPGPQANDRR